MRLPEMVPAPPSTRPVMSWKARAKPTLSGLTIGMTSTNMPPATAAKPALTAKAPVFQAAGQTPLTAAPISLSRSGLSARPTRLRTMLEASRNISAAMAAEHEELPAGVADVEAEPARLLPVDVDRLAVGAAGVLVERVELQQDGEDERRGPG